jgi:hypothetical protein
MLLSRILVVMFVSLAALFSLACISSAQTVKIIYSFDGAMGANPSYVTLAYMLTHDSALNYPANYLPPSPCQ